MGVGRHHRAVHVSVNHHYFEMLDQDSHSSGTRDYYESNSIRLIRLEEDPR